MFRHLRTLLLVLCAGALTAFGIYSYHTPAVVDRLQERFSSKRFSQFDDLIIAAGKKHGVDPRLIKALVWRESKFRPEMTGTSGERGLMQVSEAAARDWAKAEKVMTFAPTDLFDPKVNLDAGVWYLAKAAEHWKGKDNPVPFTLAEYNAGKTRVDRWIKESGKGEEVTAADLVSRINFPTTRKYIEDITAREQLYRSRNEL